MAFDLTRAAERREASVERPGEHRLQVRRIVALGDEQKHQRTVAGTQRERERA